MLKVKEEIFHNNKKGRMISKEHPAGARWLYVTSL